MHQNATFFTKFQHNPPLVQMMSTSTDGDGGSSTSSSGSIGSSEQSSGYGSQNAIVKPFNNDGGAGGVGGGSALNRISETARNSNAASARVAIKPLQKTEPSGKCKNKSTPRASLLAFLCLPLGVHGQIHWLSQGVSTYDVRTRGGSWSHRKTNELGKVA